MVFDRPNPLRISKSPAVPCVTNVTNAHATPRFSLHIPRRSSSMNSDSRHASYGSSTSTAITPPIDAGSEKLEVRKIRSTSLAEVLSQTKKKTAALRPSGLFTRNKGYSRINQDIDEDKAECRKHVLSRFFSALDPRSRNPSSGSNSEIFNHQLEATHPATMPIRSVQLCATPVETGSNRPSSPIRPSALPVTTVQMELWADKTEVDLRKTRTWVNIEITADVDMESGRLPVAVQPLDVVIILDIMERSSIVLLTLVANAAYVLASALDACDRLAIVCVDNSEDAGLRVLLPLKSHPLVGVKNVLDGLPELALEGRIWNRSGLNKAIRGASDMLVEESYSLPHIFLISADRRQSLAVPRIHPSVGFHTISFDRQFQRAEEGPYGWHISPDTAARVPECRDAVLMNKIVRVVTHLHTGLESGVVSNLVLHVMAGRGCRIESLIGDTYRGRLRPGEKWALSALVRVKEPDEEQTSLDGAIEQLMLELQQMLECNFETNPCILGAGLTYHHSLLTPGDGFISMAGCCQGIQPPQGNFGSDLA